MKNTLSLFIGLMFLFSQGSVSAQTNTSANLAQKNLDILISPGLYNLGENWAMEYSKLNPALNIKMLGKIPVSPENGSIIKISEYPGAEGEWTMVIGRDAVVPVINSGNPMLGKIAAQGISSEGFAQIFKSEKPGLNVLTNSGQNEAMRYYFIDDELIIKSIADFSKKQAGEVGGIKLASKEEFVSRIQNDRNAIGFCRLSDVIKENSGELVESIRLLPIDKNGNNRLDYFENIYKTPADFMRGVWLGKYPDELSGKIYASSNVKPTDENILSFFTWILTDGGSIPGRHGYIGLTGIEKETALNSLMPSGAAVKAEPPKTSVSWLVIMAGLLIIAILTIIIKTIRSKKPAVSEDDIKIVPALDENIITAPGGLFFDKTHTWAFMEKDGQVRIGVDDFLQHLTGKLTGVRMKDPGQRVIRGEKIFTLIHDGKHLDIHSPVSGIIKERNKSLLTDSSVINSSPYSEGWIYMIEPRNWLRETEFLFMRDRYKEWLRSEFLRLKDFIATAVRSNSLAYEHVILQDGGQITDNVLADLGPEVWEDFQTKFIDAAR